MQKISIFYLLLTFQIFSFILTKESLDSIDDDISKCQEQTDLSQCSAIQMETKGLQCCIFNTTIYFESIDPDVTDECNYITDPLEIGKDEMQTENGKIIVKEFSGFNIFSYDVGIEFNHLEYEFTCKDDSLNMRIYKENYTEAEKAAFKSDNLCMRYFMGKTGEEITPKKCYDSTVATAKEGSGVSCGYYEYTLNFEDGNSTKFNTCFLFNEDFAKNKNIGLWTKMLSISTAKNKASRLEKKLLSFQMSFSNSKGNNLIYDSVTDTVIVDGDSEEEEEEN